MVIIQVYVRVKEPDIDAFISATIKNAGSSIKEPGVVRFDLMQESDDPQAFLLTEIYQNDEAPLAHKRTDHYHIWRETVADMMQQPRKGVKYTAIYPVNVKQWVSQKI